MVDQPSNRGLARQELHQIRETAIATLTEAFARDEIDLETLERRLGSVQNAEDATQIGALVGDLVPATELLPSAVIVPELEVRPSDRILAVLGSTERRGTWTGARQLRATAVFGSTVLDFREARLPAGAIDLHVTAVFGSIEIIVPPGLAVEMHGTGILGSFEATDRAPADPEPDRPVLRIRGSAVFGSVEIATRLPGESSWQAWWRARAERKTKQLGSG